ncbi:MAG: hypothetical protein HY434_00510 [Candidatus Liptonbacteria bacterium]|nr:hypothetical protein [Candidatus Liptonbacteria bacterium]
MEAFDREAVLAKMESLRRPSGAFAAAPTADYRAVWLRDHLYTTYSYYYLGQPYFEKLIQGVRVAFDIFKQYRDKLIDLPEGNPKASDFVHAKFDADTLKEITGEWGHHQLDAIGLFLHMMGDLDFKHIKVIRDEEDLEILELLVLYLTEVRYWKNPDFGMWEEELNLHASSIAACVSGLEYVKRRGIIQVPQTLVNRGIAALGKILPNESLDLGTAHGHASDMAQLSLIWPYNLAGQHAEEIMRRIASGEKPLAQKHGLNRYWGDNYYRSANGVSGEWPMGFFWLSIVCSQFHQMEDARKWFEQGVGQMVDGNIPELYMNDHPNKHTPLAWAHAIALIADVKLRDMK